VRGVSFAGPAGWNHAKTECPIRETDDRTGIMIYARKVVVHPAGNCVGMERESVLYAKRFWNQTSARSTSFGAVAR